MLSEGPPGSGMATLVLQDLTATADQCTSAIFLAAVGVVDTSSEVLIGPA